jgi:hypothetical protein
VQNQNEMLRRLRECPSRICKKWLRIWRATWKNCLVL